MFVIEHILVERESSLEGCHCSCIQMLLYFIKKIVNVFSNLHCSSSLFSYLSILVSSLHMWSRLDNSESRELRRGTTLY